MVWLRVVVELPAASTALHVLVVVFAQEVPPVTSLPTCTTETVLQLSEAVGGVNIGVAVHSIVAFAPALPMVGPAFIVTDGLEEGPLVLVVVHVLLKLSATAPVIV